MCKIRLTEKEWKSFLKTTGLENFESGISINLADKLRTEANDWYNDRKEFTSTLYYLGKAGKVLSLKSDSIQRGLRFKASVTQMLSLKVRLDYAWYNLGVYTRGCQSHIDIKIGGKGRVSKYARLVLDSQIVEISDFDVLTPEPTILMRVGRTAVYFIEKLAFDELTRKQVAAILLDKGNEQQVTEAAVYLTKGLEGLNTLDVMRDNLEATKLELDIARKAYLDLEAKYNKLVEAQLKVIT
jgi:hypothetical protein